MTLGYLKSGRLGFEMFPNVEADVALCAYTLPYGSPVEDTRSIQDQLLQDGDTAITKIEKEFGMPIVKGAQSTIGGRTWGRMNPGGGHAGRIRYELLPPNERPISTEEFAQRWRAEATGIKGLKSIRFRANSGGPGGNQDAFSVDLSHRDMDVLEAASQSWLMRYKGIPSYAILMTDLRPEKTDRLFHSTRRPKPWAHISRSRTSSAQLILWR